ncbi:uncharacterized protein LOC143074446 [Mytilus galloprovincialis]|uniref:uncharacterized protein LOC143074446 n=1 Tax=Mytilus galloprovincialis TaxID=29158 RepID=UPI003F7C7E90
MLQRKVSPVYGLSVIYMISIIGPASGSEIYGDCIKYTVGEIKPVLTDGDRFCLQEQGYVYCKEFKCPPTVCESPLVPENLKCQYCEGTCSYGGTVYQVGSDFECLDGSNQCHCGKENRIASTKAGQNYRWMCKK